MTRNVRTLISYVVLPAYQVSHLVGSRHSSFDAVLVARSFTPILSIFITMAPPAGAIYLNLIYVGTSALSSPGYTCNLPQPSSTCNCIRFCKESFVEGGKACVHTLPLGALVWSMFVHFQHTPLFHRLYCAWRN